MDLQPAMDRPVNSDELLASGRPRVSLSLSRSDSMQTLEEEESTEVVLKASRDITRV